MSVVRTEWNLDQIAGRPATPFLRDEFPHDSDHVDITIQMGSLVEAFRIFLALRRTEMSEVDPFCKPAHHCQQVVIRPNSERASAESNAVRRFRSLIQEELKIVSCADDSRQSEQRTGWIVRMDAEAHSDFFSLWTSGPKEFAQVAS